METCKNCGGTLEFNPSTQRLKCTKCLNEVDFPKTKNCVFHNFEMETPVDESDYNPRALSMHCPSCGAVFADNNSSISSSCMYCGSHLVADYIDKSGAPDACVAYAFDKVEAMLKFKEGLKHKWFLPNKFKKAPPLKSIDSVYIPAYLYNIETDNLYAGRLYNSHRDRDGNIHRSYFKISGQKKLIVDDAIVECSSQMNQLSLENIKPYDLSNIYKFRPEFLMGYSVEYYNQKVESTKSIIKEMVKNRVRRHILSCYNYDGVDYLNVETKFTSCAFSRVILPTYRVNYKYREKKYATFMNGQTGKVGGNLPRSGLKIGLFVLGILSIVGAIAYLIISSNL